MKIYVIPILYILLLSGCISDDYDNCEPAKLYFSYTGDGTTEILNQEINKVDLYVYDADDRNVFAKTIEGDQLHRNRGVILDLAAGEYDVVCIANDYENTIVSTNANDYTKNFITHPNYLEKEIIPENDSLYYGYKRITISEEDKYRKVSDTISFRSSHIEMYIEIVGVEPLPTKSSILSHRIAIHNLLPAIDFSNNPSGTPVSYYPPVDYYPESEMICSEFNILRQRDYSNVVIDLIDEDGDIRNSLKLTDFLSDRPYIDVKKQEAVIAMRIELYFDGSIRVTIPDWYIKHVYPEF